MPPTRKDLSPDSPKTTDALRPATRRAIKTPATIAMFVIITAAALSVDLISKHMVFQSLLDDPALQKRLTEINTSLHGSLTSPQALRIFRRPVGLGIQLSLSTNPGVVFGLPMPRWVVAAATLLIVGFIFYYFALSDRRDRYLHLGLALILGGAVGNLYDRLFSAVCVPGFEPIRHQVRDFIDCSEFYIHYPWVFNVADAWLVVGVAILMVHWWFMAAAEKKRHAATTTR